MSRKGEYSDKYGFHISKLVFDCGAQSISSATHGTLTSQDIDGAQPRRFTAERQTSKSTIPQSSEGSAGVSKRKLPLEPRNPLDPQYHLPEVPPPPPVEHVKFIRDTLNISDIDGAQKQTAKRVHEKLPATMDNSDIDGSTSQGSNKKMLNKQIRTAYLDVSDINNGAEGKGKGSATATKTSSSIQQEIDNQFIGKQKTLQGRQEYFSNMRTHGSDIIQARQQAKEQIVEAVISSESIPTTLSSLSIACKARDRCNNGLLQHQEFQEALQECKFPDEQARKFAKELCKTDPGGLIEYQSILGQIFEKGIQNNTSIPSEEKERIAAPSGHEARQRRVKTDVAQALGQQPKATEDAAKQVSTPQELKEKKESRFGKKMEGFSGKNVDSTQGNTLPASAWFGASTTIEHNDDNDNSNNSSTITNNDNNASEGKKEVLWFSSTGTDEKSMNEMKVWKPTKDAAIAVDLRKERTRNHQKEGNETDTKAVGDNTPIKGVPLSLKKAATATIDVKRVHTIDKKDVEMVKSLS